MLVGSRWCGDFCGLSVSRRAAQRRFRVGAFLFNPNLLPFLPSALIREVSLLPRFLVRWCQHTLVTVTRLSSFYLRSFFPGLMLLLRMLAHSLGLGGNPTLAQLPIFKPKGAPFPTGLSTVTPLEASQGSLFQRGCSGYLVGSLMRGAIKQKPKRAALRVWAHLTCSVLLGFMVLPLTRVFFFWWVRGFSRLT